MMLWHKKDVEATRKMKFLDKRSFVTTKSRLKLFGTDMMIQRALVFEVDNFRCRVCGRSVGQHGELDHYPLSRGKGGGDEMENLRLVCQPCHRQRHCHPSWSDKKIKALAEFDAIEQG